MKEIKFRAWLKEEKIMVDVEEIDLGTNNIGFYIEDNYEFRSFKDVELMQFTGLYDKNGTPIYEGDIVRAKISQDEDLKLYNPLKKMIIGYVCYDEDFCLFYLKNNFMKFMNWAFNDEIEVIGNIYENANIL